MEYRTLGNTGLQVSAVALGCEGFLGKDRAEMRAMLDFAWEQGINFIDMYSPDPAFRRILGEWVREKRGRFFLQSHLCSVWEDGQYLRTRDLGKTKAGFAAMLEELGTDFIDIGMIHYVDDDQDYDGLFDSGIIDFAKQQLAEGKIRHLGMSSHNPLVALRAAQSGLFGVILFSINPAYDMQPATEDVEEYFDNANFQGGRTNIDPDRQRFYDYCASHGIGLDVMKPYGGGNLLDAAQSPFGQALTVVQCIDYALARPAVAAVMCGCRSLEEIRSALAWCGASPEEKDYTAVLSGLESFSWTGKCMYCGHCAPCTSDIRIADVNKFYNLTVAEGCVPETVREHYRALAHHASECVECGACETRCPFGVDIIAGMRKAAETFGY